MNATPEANTSVPAMSTTVFGARPMIVRPTAEIASAAPDRRAAPNRSGQVAPTIRRPTTTRAYAVSGRPTPSSPTSGPYSGRNVRNPAIPHRPKRMMIPGKMPAGWMSGPRGGRSPGATLRPGADSGTSNASATATAATIAAAIQTAVYEPAAKIVSATGGPIAIPRYSDRERKLIASPRRASGAMSAAAASAATKKKPSPAPSRPRAIVNTSRSFATR